MKKITLVLAMLVPVALVSGCRGSHHGELDLARVDKRVTEHLDDFLDDAKASDAQRARLLAIKNRLLPEGGALATSQRQVQREIATQLASERPDPARLHALVDQQIDALRAFAHKSVDGAVEAHGTLTPEQRKPVTRKLQRFASR